MILTHFFLLNACEGEKNLDKKMNEKPNPPAMLGRME